MAAAARYRKTTVTDDARIRDDVIGQASRSVRLASVKAFEGGKRLSVQDAAETFVDYCARHLSLYDESISLCDTVFRAIIFYLGKNWSRVDPLFPKKEFLAALKTAWVDYKFQRASGMAEKPRFNWVVIPQKPVVRLGGPPVITNNEVTIPLNITWEDEEE